MSTWHILSTRARVSPSLVVSFQTTIPTPAPEDGDHSWVQRVDGRDPADLMTLQLSGQALADFRQLMQYAMNCRWEQMSEDMRTLSDILNHGNKMPSHRDPLHDAKPATQS